MLVSRLFFPPISLSVSASARQFLPGRVIPRSRQGRGSWWEQEAEYGLGLGLLTRNEEDGLQVWICVHSRAQQANPKRRESLYSPPSVAILCMLIFRTYFSADPEPGSSIPLFHPSHADMQDAIVQPVPQRWIGQNTFRPLLILRHLTNQARHL